jgi:hypothetical protein
VGGSHNARDSFANTAHGRQQQQPASPCPRTFNSIPWQRVSVVAVQGLSSIWPGGHCVHRLHLVLCVSVHSRDTYLFGPHALHALRSMTCHCTAQDGDRMYVSCYLAAKLRDREVSSQCRSLTCTHLHWHDCRSSQFPAPHDCALLRHDVDSRHSHPPTTSPDVRAVPGVHWLEPFLRVHDPS